MITIPILRIPIVALRNLTLVGVAVAVVMTALMWSQKVEAAATPQATIDSFGSSTSELSSTGGDILLTGFVTNSTSCTLAVVPAIVGVGGLVPCKTGTLSTSLTLPANNTPSAMQYSITLTLGSMPNNWAGETIVVTVDSATSSTVPPTYPAPHGNTVSVPAEPDALVRAGADIWVASCSGNAVTEINDSTQQIVRELSGSIYGFICPDAIAYDGTNIWVANSPPSSGSGSVTELSASNGDLVRILTGTDINGPLSLTVANADLWIGNSSNITGGFLSEYNIATGSFDRIVVPAARGSAWSIVEPLCISYTGKDIWVSDQLSDTVVEFNESTGAYLRHTVYTGPGNVGLSNVPCVSFHSGYIWADGQSNSVVVEYNARTGAYVRSVKNVWGPSQVIFTGSRLLVIVINPKDAVREYNAEGNFLRTVATSGYYGGKGFSAMAVDDSKVWTANYTNGSVSAWKL
jgi:hypothetical protein